MSTPRACRSAWRGGWLLARALSVTPKLLLLDEPFAALDPATAGRMQDLIGEEVARLGATVLMVTHSRAEAMALATRVIGLDGSPARITADEAVGRPRAGDLSPPATPPR